MYNKFKRLFDIFIALLLAIFTFPLLVLVVLSVKLTSKGPVFYLGERTGLNDNSFYIFKIRTMVVNAELLGGPSTALNDKRLIKIGPFLRKYKLDELPQIYNILKGDMSFVGPRPQVKKYTSLYKGEEKIILTVRPGLTDYSTLHFMNMDMTLGDSLVDEKYLKEVEPKKNLLRIKYVKEKSFRTDLYILFKTFIKLIQNFF